MKLGIFIFRKDLRIVDNRGLIKLGNEVDNIIPIFIFDPKQIKKNSYNKNYLSFRALKFICESVKELEEEIKENNGKLYIFNDDVIKVLEEIIKNREINNNELYLSFNKDFTKYSIERDNKIIEFCNKNNIKYIENDDDITLCDMKYLIKEDGEAYKQYGAFRKNMLKHKDKFNDVINKKINNFSKKYKLKTINNLERLYKKEISDDYEALQIGGRNNALEKLKKLKEQKDYNTNRDFLTYNTTHLSAYLNFGCISEREFYEAILDKLTRNSQLISQIIWRDYYICLLRYLKNADSYENHIDNRYDKLKWKNNKKAWNEWETMMESKTGFLLVDAAIQEIKKTGYMHNRCRMIVGVFSVKYLLIHPFERYIGLHDWFSRHLLDCNTSQNKLNCQWVTELDFPGKKFSAKGSVLSGRPMNISNIMIKKWDSECGYIKKWLPHLKDVDNKILYNWDTKFNEDIHPKPMFNPKDRYDEWIDLCKN